MSKVTIDLEAIANNYQWACQNSPNSQNIAVIKANAYGHGSVAVAKKLEQLAPAFATSRIDEAEIIRAATIKQPILILEGVHNLADYQLSAEQNYWLVIHSLQQWQQFKAASVSHKLTIWLELELGMHRTGLTIAEFKTITAELAVQSHKIANLVVMAHLANAASGDIMYIANKLAEFKQYASDYQQSLANSASFLCHPQTRLDWNRLGIMLYGASAVTNKTFKNLQPAMTLSGKIISIKKLTKGDCVGYFGTWQADKDCTIATVSLGYSDGYPQSAPSASKVFINGNFAKTVGTVSMHLTCIDISHLDAVAIGDAVEFWGKNISVDSVAANNNTIGHELLVNAGGN